MLGRVVHVTPGGGGWLVGCAFVREMGLILLRNGQDREGVRWLESALREHPGCAAARQALEDHSRRSAEAGPGARVSKK
jgi:hypothetical protein